MKKTLKTVNLFFIIPLFFIALLNLDFYLIFSSLLLLTLSKIKRADLMWLVFIFNLNYSLGFIVISFYPESRLFFDLYPNTENLSLVFFLLTVIIFVSSILVITFPIRGRLDLNFTKPKISIIKYSIIVVFIFTFFGFNKIGYTVGNPLVAYILRIFLMFNLLFPLIFLTDNKKLLYFYLLISIITSYFAGSRAIAIVIVFGLVQIGLIYNFGIKKKYLMLLSSFILFSIIAFPFISALRIGQDFSFTADYVQQLMDIILTIRSRFGGIDVSFALYELNYTFPYYQLLFEFIEAINRYLPGDIFPKIKEYYPSEFLVGKVFGGDDFSVVGLDVIKNTESMRLGRFFALGPISIILSFLVFIVGLNIQSKDMTTNYLLRFVLINNWITQGGIYESFLVIFDMLILLIFLYYIYERKHIKLSNI